MRQAHGALAAFLFTAGMFLAVFASAGLIPTVFEPGRIELLLSKPVRRYHILLGRYLGNVLVIAANIFYLVFAVWLIFGIKTGVWTAGFLWSSVLTVFMFAVLLTVVVLVGVLWESAVVATMVTFGIMIVSPILAQQQTLERLLTSEMVAQRGPRALLRAAQSFRPRPHHALAGAGKSDRRLDAGVELGAVRRGGAGRRDLCIRKEKLLTWERWSKGKNTDAGKGRRSPQKRRGPALRPGQEVKRRLEMGAQRRSRKGIGKGAWIDGNHEARCATCGFC